ncbi:MAG: biopolymer transporter ExbD [Bdellovibrionales bacterium]|nr:biopolymer transporter ExbD [Bdellovibrionales bacterium]
MSRTYTKKIDQEESSSFELDLAPMLALMVTLIPILLLSTVFVQVVVIDTPLPQVVQDAIEQEKNNKDRQVQLVLGMSSSSGFNLSVNIDGKQMESISVPLVEGQLDVNGLHEKLVKVKRTHPKVFRLDLNPSEDVGYSDIVKVMDSVRSFKKEEGTVTILDQKTNESAETNLMFPEVVFGNVVEG